jgi:hypothetical protein
MASPTYTLISSNTLSSSAASVTFSAIPATYTDLLVKISARSDDGGNLGSLQLSVNGTSANHSSTEINGYNTTASSSRRTATTRLWFENAVDAGSITANTFSSIEIYIPNYLSSVAKPMSGDYGAENNSSSIWLRGATAGLWNNTSAITSLVFYQQGFNFVSGSSFYLYGIKNS